MAEAANTEVAASMKDHPKILAHLKDHLHNFDTKELKNVESQHKVVLPTAEILAQEKSQEKLRHGIKGFNAAQMKKVETQEKNPLPTQEAIDQEKLH